MARICLIFFTVALLFLSPSNSIIIYQNNINNTNNNTTNTIESYYTTIGNPPKEVIHSSAIFLSNNNFSNDCWFSKTTNISKIKNKIAILTEYPLWHKCIHDGTGKPAVMGKIFQKVGAIGLIVVERESVYIFIYIMYFNFFHSSIIFN